MFFLNSTFSFENVEIDNFPDNTLYGLMKNNLIFKTRVSMIVCLCEYLLVSSTSWWQKSRRFFSSNLQICDVLYHSSFWLLYYPNIFHVYVLDTVFYFIYLLQLKCIISCHVSNFLVNPICRSYMCHVYERCCRNP